MTRWVMVADLRRCVGCQTCTARSLRPISSHTAPSPAAMSTRPNATNGLQPGVTCAVRAVEMSTPEPVPPRMKLVAARRSQCRCSQGLGP